MFAITKIAGVFNLIAGLYLIVSGVLYFSADSTSNVALRSYNLMTALFAAVVFAVAGCWLLRGHKLSTVSMILYSIFMSMLALEVDPTAASLRPAVHLVGLTVLVITTVFANFKGSEDRAQAGGGMIG